MIGDHDDQEARDLALEKAAPPVGPSDPPPPRRRGFAIERVIAARAGLLADVHHANLPLEGWLVVISAELADLTEAAPLRDLDDTEAAIEAAMRSLARMGVAVLEGLKSLEAERG